MDTLIKQIFAQWKIAKEQARQDCESRSLHNLAEKYRVCDMFKGTEDLQGIIRLFTSTQGLEFCMRYHFPNIATLRLFKRYNVEKYGIYIDAGAITLKNPTRAILIGRTSATINCDTLKKHEVVLLHGANAIVNASKWSVVFVKAEQGCTFIKNPSENALIL